MKANDMLLVAALAGTRTVYLKQFNPNVFGNWKEAIRFSSLDAAKHALSTIPDGGLVVPEAANKDAEIAKRLLHRRKKNPVKRQHWIVKVRETANNKEIVSTYFDGGQAAAKKYFRNEPIIAQYWGKPGYIITMQPNSIILWDGVGKAKKNPLTPGTLEGLTDDLDSATRPELEKALKFAVEFSKDFAVPASKRKLYKDQATMIRKQLRGFGRKKNPVHEIRELVLYADNTSELQNQKDSIIKNLLRKANKGIYDQVKAAKLWQYLIDNAVKYYNKEFLQGGFSLKQNVFTMADRREAAKQMELQYRDDITGPTSNPRKKGKRKNPADKFAGPHILFISDGKEIKYVSQKVQGGKGIWFGLDAKRNAYNFHSIASATKVANYVTLPKGWIIGIAQRNAPISTIKKIIALSGKA